MHLAALRVLGDTLGVGVIVLVEGEEEIGSPTLPTFLDRYRERLAADVIVLADSTNWRIGVPALTTSLRGGANVVVEVRTLQHAVHNGLYGGPVPDALTVLSRLIATLHDEQGDIAVAGLSRSWCDPLDLDEDQLREGAGMLEGVQLLGTGTLTTRLWAAPAICVIGIDAPPVDSAAMTLVPSARAKLTLRVGPADGRRCRGRCTRHPPALAGVLGASVTVTAGKPVQPFTPSTSGAAHDAARAAFAEAGRWCRSRSV